MTDFARARLNMVNAQLATNGMHSDALIEAYKSLPREALVDEAQRPFVYRDEDLPLPGGKHWILEPMVEARMVQAALTEPAQTALVLGAANAPAAAMLSLFTETVTVIEPDAALARNAAMRFSVLGFGNISVIETGYREGYPRSAPYDVIFVPGAVAALSPVLCDQLSVGGRLVCILRETARAQGRVVLVRKSAEGAAGTRVVMDAATPYLAGFEPARDFVF